MIFRKIERFVENVNTLGLFIAILTLSMGFLPFASAMDDEDVDVFDSIQHTTQPADQPANKYSNALDENAGGLRGSFTDGALMFAIDINNGRKIPIHLTQGTEYVFDGKISIQLLSCWQQGDRIYGPENKALIKIIDNSSKAEIFRGWVFSNHHTISQPIYKKYFFYLEQCK